MNRILNRITAVLVSVVIAAVLILTVLFTAAGKSPDGEAEIPELTLSSLFDGSFVSGFSDYFSEHFAAREALLSVNGVIRANIGEGIVNGVYIADDMLLEMPDESQRSYEECVAAVNEYAKKYDGMVYFVASPTSSGVYSDRLPKYVEPNSEKMYIDSLYDSLRGNIRKIDAYNILKMLNDNYIYYRNDSKWTSYGAYCVYRTVIQKLGFSPSAYDKYSIEHVTADFRGNLYEKSRYSGIKADMLDVYTYINGAEVIECVGYDNDGKSHEKELYDKSFLETDDMYKMYLGEAVPFMRIRTSANTEKKLLVIKDSYADCFIPFLIQHYSEIAVVSPECLETGLSSFTDVNEYEQTLIMLGIDNICQEGLFNNINK